MRSDFDARLDLVHRELCTDRLRLRRWTDQDREPFAALNADPIVMEFYPAMLSRTESDTFVDRIEDHFDKHGFGLWAVELTETREFIGYVGLWLWPATLEAPFTPAVEVGWRLAREFWGSGFAPEAARSAIADGFDRLAIKEIVSFTSTINAKSRRVFFFFDDNHRTAAELIQGPDSTIVERKLNDGRPFRVIKIPYEPTRLGLRSMSWDIKVTGTSRPFYCGTGRRP